MFLIIGLGNPSKKYEKTRHNVGFLAVKSLQLTFNNFSDWKKIPKYQAEISEGEIAEKKVILAKPQTFMNLSGQSVKLLVTNYKLPITNLLIVHDDIDLPLGKIKIVKNRGSAGHKGVESIIKELKTKNLIRFRLGIKPDFGKPKNPEKFVLQKFKKNEEKTLEEVIKKVAEAIEMIIKEGTERTMSKYNC